MRVLIRFVRGTPRLVAAALAGTIAVATMAAADVYTRADSTSMRLKIERIVEAERTAVQRKAPAGLTTPLTQREVNSYLRYDLAPQVPVGIAEPVITIVGEGRLLGDAVVDLDAVSRANPPKGFFDPMRLLTGRLPLRVQGVLVTSRGTRTVLARVREPRRRAGPQVGAADAPEPLLAHPGQPGRHRPRRSVRAAGGDPRDPRRAGPRHRRAMSRAAALFRPLASLKGVGDRRAADLASAGLQTVEDLLVRFPLRYEDRGHPRPLAEIAPGRIASAIGTIVSAAIKRTRRPGFSVFEVVLRDRSGAARAVWFNQRFLKDVLRAGQTVALFGKVEQGAGGLQFASPQYEILADEPLAGGWLGAADADADSDPEAADESGAPPAPVEEHLGIVPIYERIGTLTPKIQRGLVAQALATLPADLPDALPDSLPDTVRRRLDLPSRRDALVAVHQPPPGSDVDALNRARSPGHVG